MKQNTTSYQEYPPVVVVDRLFLIKSSVIVANFLTSQAGTNRNSKLFSSHGIMSV
jgi:hypothetical protein